MTVRTRPTLRRRGRDRGSRFLVPAVVLLGITSVYPTLYSFYMSFFDWNWGQRLNFVGLQNYVDLFTSDQFRNALQQAKAGQVIFLPGQAQIDLTGQKRLVVPGGVTLSSQRGRDGSPGAKVFTTDRSTSRDALVSRSSDRAMEMIGSAAVQPVIQMVAPALTAATEPRMSLRTCR